MNTLILGNGFVPSHLPDHFNRSNDRLSPNERDIVDLIDRARPDAIVNCVARTGRPNIDWCESHREETLLANLTIPTLLAEICNKKGIHLIHIGSGCIFHGASPGHNGWKESDPANPQSYYSKTKYACDLAIQDLECVCILRIRMPISRDINPRNYLSKIIRYNKIIDQQNSVTFMDDCVMAVEWALRGNRTGVYHVTADPLSPVDFLNLMNEQHLKLDYEIINEENLNKITKARRSNCILDNSKIKQAGFLFSDTRKMAREYVTDFLENAHDVGLFNY